jgi:hypothetical protein
MAELEEAEEAWPHGSSVIAFAFWVETSDHTSGFSK